MRRSPRPMILLLIATLAACGSSDSAVTTDPVTTDPVAPTPSTVPDPVTTTVPAPGDQRFPDVIDAQARNDATTWTFDVTISSPYDTPERYADAWRILGPDGEEYGVRVLTHDHANEQPFTRSLSGVEIPRDVDVVTIEARDLQNGWGGTTLEVQLP